MPDLLHTCSICGQRFLPTVGHCSGGRWGGCCRSFRSGRDGDDHRIGDFNDGSRRCMTDDELRERGWVQEPDGYWISARTIRKREVLRANYPWKVAPDATEPSNP